MKFNSKMEHRLFKVISGKILIAAAVLGSITILVILAINIQDQITAVEPVTATTAAPRTAGPNVHKAEDSVSPIQHWKPLAEQGDIRAQRNLGTLYRKGRGVNQDYAQALFWYRKAAEQGDIVAQRYLGWMYFKGEGVVLDYRQSAEWYHKAAEQGDANSQGNLGWLHRHGRGVVQDHQAAVKWYRKAAEGGSDWAQRDLGWMYHKGLGVQQDKVLAYMWYTVSGAKGSQKAVKWAQNLAKTMTASQVSEAGKLARECIRKNYQGCG